MKKLYLFLFAFLSTGLVFSQEYNPNNSHSLLGSCLNPDDGTVTITFNLAENCPESDPNAVLLGTAELGFHSGVNHWATIAAWDDPNSVTWMNDGSDVFSLTINTMDYWGTPFGDVENVRVVGNNGIAEPGAAWDLVAKDSFDAMTFGALEDCSDLIIWFEQTPTCADFNQASSLSLFSDAGDSQTCVDAANGMVRIDVDYGLACPEGDTDMVLAGAPELGFHSGVNGWSTVVGWDADNAVTLVNDGNDNFSAIIDVEAYYGVPLADVMDIQMVPNNGVADPDAAWDVFIKDPRDGGFGGTEPCSDLIMVMSEAPACNLVNTKDIELQHSFKVTPNPFSNRTFLEFDNPNNRTFDLVITNMAGQTVRTMSSISGERVLVERGNLPTGVYAANLIDEKGNFATTKLVIK